MTPKINTQRNKSDLTLAYNDYKKGLNSYAFFKLPNSVVGEDLVQDTFMKTWAFLVKGGKITMMKAFLYHILNNLIIDEYRKQSNKSESLDNLIEAGFEPKDEQTGNLTNILDGKAAMNRIGELPEN